MELFMYPLTKQTWPIKAFPFLLIVIFWARVCILSIKMQVQFCASLTSTLEAPTTQNGQTYSNNSAAICNSQ